MSEGTEVGFYHLTRSALEPALGRLLERVLDSGLRAVVRASSAERADALNRALWQFGRDSFLPHGARADGSADFYTPEGASVRRSLMRTPIDGARLSSGFGLRKHPILGYSRMHRGTDFAAPRGTPIYAAGNGVVDFAGRKGGYGKYVRIRHGSTYQTAYGHMSAFARGVEEGKRVRQGQVIGFIGSTGLSTGSHLHYEILVNGRFVDPMRIRLPRGRVLEGRMLTAFDQERERLDGIMARKPARVASSAPVKR